MGNYALTLVDSIDVFAVRASPLSLCTLAERCRRSLVTNEASNQPSETPFSTSALATLEFRYLK